MAHTIKVAGHDLQMLDWPEARKLGWSEQKYLDQYDYTKRLGELLRKERSETKARRAREEYDRDTCESCGDVISFKRLLARPVTTLCIDCKEQHEREEAAVEQAGRGGALDASAGEEMGGAGATSEE